MLRQIEFKRRNIIFRAPGKLADQIERAAKQAGVNRSEAVRQLIILGLNVNNNGGKNGTN